MLAGILIGFGLCIIVQALAVAAFLRWGWPAFVSVAQGWFQ